LVTLHKNISMAVSRFTSLCYAFDSDLNAPCIIEVLFCNTQRDHIVNKAADVAYVGCFSFCRRTKLNIRCSIHKIVRAVMLTILNNNNNKKKKKKKKKKKTRSKWQKQSN
jgi:hypothetical protein